MSFSNFLENELLDHVFSAATYTAPATLYLALSTADPTDDGSGLAEPGGGSYARAAVTNNATEWPAASGGTKQNANTISFVQATASWGTITHFALFDAVSGGNMLGHGALSASKSVTLGDQPRFIAGAITITLD
jgi:hypothetical protein